MPKINGTRFMINFVLEYLNDDMDRLSFDLDFNYYLLQNFSKMERENCGLADCLNFYLAENGIDFAQNSDDSAHKKLIRKQWATVEEIMRDGSL